MKKYVKFLSPDLQRIIAWMIDPNPLMRPKASELLNDPAIRRFKVQRYLHVMKHQIVTFIYDKLFWVFSYLFFPIMYIVNIGLDRFHRERMSTPQEERMAKPVFLVNSDSSHPRISLSGTPTFSDSEEGEYRSLSLSNRRRVFMSDSPEMHQVHRDRGDYDRIRRIPRLDFNQPISSKKKTPKNSNTSTSES